MWTVARLCLLHSRTDFCFGLYCYYTDMFISPCYPHSLVFDDTRIILYLASIINKLRRYLYLRRQFWVMGVDVLSL